MVWGREELRRGNSTQFGEFPATFSITISWVIGVKLLCIKHYEGFRGTWSLLENILMGASLRPRCWETGVSKWINEWMVFQYSSVWILDGYPQYLFFFLAQSFFPLLFPLMIQNLFPLKWILNSIQVWYPISCVRRRSSLPSIYSDCGQTFPWRE